MVRPILATVLLSAMLIACAGDSTAPEGLSEAAAEGWRVMQANGCNSCHGDNGEGGAGPALAGLYGSEVELEDGSTVVADDTYLERSIREPNAERVAGFRINMPQNDLTDAEIAAVLGYLRELGGDA